MANTGHNDNCFKILIIGDSRVGKTSLLRRLTDDVFKERYTHTYVADFRSRYNAEIDDKKVQLEIWDTGGQKRFRTIVRSYFSSSHGFLLVYDVTDVNSFASIEDWAKDVNALCKFGTSMILIGNKSDKEDEITIGHNLGKDLADKLGIPFMETSAKLNTNIEQAFIALAVKMKNRRDSELLTSVRTPKTGRLASKGTMRPPCCVLF